MNLLGRLFNYSVIVLAFCVIYVGGAVSIMAICAWIASGRADYLAVVVGYLVQAYISIRFLKQIRPGFNVLRPLKNCVNRS